MAIGTLRCLAPVVVFLSLVARPAIADEGGLEQIVTIQQSDYRIVLFGGRLVSDVLEIWRDGHLVDRIVDQDVMVLEPRMINGDTVFVPLDRSSSAARWRSFRPVDVTGDGKLDLLVEAHRGRGYCCKSIHIMELADPYRVVFEADMGGDSAKITRIEGRPDFEIRIRDDHFRDWRMALDRADYPDIVMRYDGTTYRIDADRMRLPPLNDETFQRKATEAHESKDWGQRLDDPVAAEVWESMIELAYSGNLEQADRLFDAAWRTGVRNKESLLAQFHCRLQSGPFWPEIAAMNGLADPQLVPEHCDDGASVPWNRFREIAVVEQGRYRVYLYAGLFSEDVVEIWGGDRLLDRISDQRLSLGVPRSANGKTHLNYVEKSAASETRHLFSLSDMTGDGKPNLIVKGWSGGAHCCETLHILELADSYRVVFREVLGDGMSYLSDMDGRPGLEIDLLDTQFGVWVIGFARGHMPRVVLRYDGDGYQVAPDLMRGPPLDEVTFQEKAAAVRASPDWGITEEALVAPELWHVMVDLVYSGNFDPAERFMDAAWKPGWPTREVFWDRFRCNLQHGRFWPGIAALNGFEDPMLMPEDCETGDIEQG